MYLHKVHTAPIMRLCQWMTEQGVTARQLQRLLGLGSHNSVYRYLRVERGEPGGQVPESRVMRRLIALTGGAVTPNDFHGINGGASQSANGGAPNCDGAPARNGRAQGSSPARLAVPTSIRPLGKPKRKRVARSIVIAKNRKSAATRRRMRKARSSLRGAQ